MIGTKEERKRQGNDDDVMRGVPPQPALLGRRAGHALGPSKVRHSHNNSISIYGLRLAELKLNSLDSKEPPPTKEKVARILPQQSRYSTQATPCREHTAARTRIRTDQGGAKPTPNHHISSSPSSSIVSTSTLASKPKKKKRKKKESRRRSVSL